MLDRISFKNFKSLRSLTLELSPLTVLVGPNGSGKSSVLTAIHLLSQTGIRRPPESLPWERFGITFAGPRDPRRLASSASLLPETLEMAMRETAGDELTLAILLPAPSDEQPDDREFHVSVNGPAGPLRATIAGQQKWDVAARTAAETVLNDPRVRHFASVAYLHLDATVMCRTSTSDEELPRMAANGEGLAS